MTLTSHPDTGEKRQWSQSQMPHNPAESHESKRPRTPQSSLSANNAQSSRGADPNSRCNEETFRHRDEPSHVLSSSGSTHENEAAVVITTIRATDVALGLRRLPAGFYTSVHHDNREWRTENKPSLVNHDVVEWSDSIPIPSDPSATIRFVVYASFEFQPMLGTGEQLRELSITMEQLLDHSAKGVPFSFSPKDGDVLSPCSSISMTIERRKPVNNGVSVSSPRALAPHWSAIDLRGMLERATNQGHSALSRYRKYKRKRDLERSIKEFEVALCICPLGHPCRAAARSNLAMARFILCQLEHLDGSLDVPLELYRNALAARPIGHLDRPSTLIQLATVHLARFQKRGDHSEAGEAEALLREATQLVSATRHENRTATFICQMLAGGRADHVQPDSRSSVKHGPISPLASDDPQNLAIQLVERFKQFGNLSDLQQAIAILQETVRSSSIWDSRHSEGLAHLGVALSLRFLRLIELSDLEDALSALRDSVELTSRDHPHRPRRLSNLGNCYLTRFQCLGQRSDLDDAISMLKDAVDLTPHSHFEKPAYLNNLAVSFKTRFESLGQPSDLDNAISMLRVSVDLTPHGRHDKPRRLSNLGSLYIIRFERIGQISDLDDAIPILKDAIDLIPHDHPDRPACLNNLSNAFVSRFERLGELGDLEDAIWMLRDAVGLIPHGHSQRPASLNNLGTHLFARFELLGDLNDLEEAVSMLKNAVDLSSRGHPEKPVYLNNLGIFLRCRFERLWESNDLQDAISAQRDAIDLVPHGQPSKSHYLSNLGNTFMTRFRRFGEPSDLEDAISRQKDAVDLIPHGHPEKPTHLCNLGSSMMTRFRHFKEAGDLEYAISTLRDAVDLIPRGHPGKPILLHNLGTSLVSRFDSFGKLSDLEDAISMFGDAVDLTPHSHLNMPSYLANLGGAFRARFQHLRQLRDLDDAISILKDAVNLTSHGDPHKLYRLESLAACFRIRYEHLGELSSLEQAISLHSHVALVPIGPIHVRFRASRNWMACARHIRHHSLIHACSVTLRLLPQLAWIGLTLSHRYDELTQDSDVVREAAAAALDVGLPETAVEWLEQGRSIVWRELLQLRSSYEELSSAHPDHARRLRELSTELDHASVTREKTLSSLSEQVRGVAHVAIESSHHEADTHRALAIERDELLREIRRLPGFGQFLLRKQFSQLRAAAHSGPVVIVNAAESRCDALVVLADVDHVIHVPLPNFTLQRSAGLQNALEKLLGHARGIPPEDRQGHLAPWKGVSWESLLSTSWTGIVKPVLDGLALTTPGELTRIFWCPTGPFAFLPIHAAGFYDDPHSQPGHKASDFVISSYIPSLSILTLSSKPCTAPSNKLRLLAVRQPPSDGLSKLRGVPIELEHIKEAIRNSPSSQITLVESSVGTVEEVLDLMKEADWVHFACHGIQDAADSGLCLADRRRLKLRDIIALSRPGGGLAFLSACQTAMGDEKLSDEAIHIAAGMLFAGYGGVVGTMWSISDRLAPDVARDMYAQLFEKDTRPDYREAARALHQAVGRLREKNASFVDWLPFIHVGL